MSHIPSSQRGPRAGYRLLLLLALPALLFLLTFYYVPLGQVFAEAFRPNADDIRPIGDILRDAYFWRLLRFTALQAAYSAVGSLIIGFPLGFILANRSFKGRELLQSLTLVPFVLPSVAVALGFLIFFGHQGVLNNVIHAVFGVRVQLLYTIWGIVLAHAFYNAPVIARTVQAAWSGLDPSYDEAAASLGVGPRRRFTTVTLRLIISGVISGTLLAFIFSFFSFSIVLALGGSQFQTLEVAVYTQVRVLLNYPVGAALAMTQTVFSLVAAYFYLGVERRYSTAAVQARRARLQPLTKPTAMNSVLWVYLALIAVFYAGPLLTVIVDSIRAPDGSLSLDAYKRMFVGGYDRRIGDSPTRALRNSLVFAGGALALALPLAGLLAFSLSEWNHRARKKWHQFIGQAIETLSLAPLAISSIAFGFAALRAYRTGVWASLGLTTETAIVLAHAILATPFIVRALRPAFEQIDRRYVEASQALGASRMQAFKDVELPLAAAGLIVGAALGFTLSLTEMSATIMLARPGLSTLPLSIYQRLAARDFTGAAAMSVVLVVLTGIALVGLEKLALRLTRRHN